MLRINLLNKTHIGVKSFKVLYLFVLDKIWINFRNEWRRYWNFKRNWSFGNYLIKVMINDLESEAKSILIVIICNEYYWIKLKKLFSLKKHEFEFVLKEEVTSIFNEIRDQINVNIYLSIVYIFNFFFKLKIILHYLTKSVDKKPSTISQIINQSRIERLNLIPTQTYYWIFEIK